MEVRHPPRKPAEVVLRALLDAYARPAFGSLSKSELDCLMLGAMQDTGIIAARPSQHELMTALRIPRGRARNLLLKLELRTMSHDALELRLKELLIELRLLKDGTHYAIAVDSPFLLEHVKERVGTLGHAARLVPGTDFVQLSQHAVVALIEAVLPRHAHAVALERAKSQGLPDSSVKGYIRHAVQSLGPALVASTTSDATTTAWAELSKLLVPG